MPRKPTSRRALMTWVADELESPKHVTPARAASLAPQVADTRRSSPVIAILAVVSFRNQAANSPSSLSRNPRMTVSSRCECALIRPGRIAAWPKSETLASGNRERTSTRGPAATILDPSTATAPSSIAGETIGSTHRAAQLVVIDLSPRLRSGACGRVSAGGRDGAITIENRGDVGAGRREIDASYELLFSQGWRACGHATPVGC